ncbi:uncharacterized protein LOC143288376 [Babylonia areolata]|uniref:uncharacterized protein LOC143288376 n=1 Tax=Babylonia areolata TaxID=304850 RepID=UPI003FCFE669
MWQTIFVLALWVAPALSDLTLRQQTCDANRRHVSVATSNANVLLAGLFDIREASSGPTGCGLPSKELLQAYEAARWTIKQLNSNNYVSGVRFGLEAYDTCTLEASALESVQDFYPQIVSRAGTSSNGVPYCTKSSSQYKLGMIGPMQSSVSMSVAEMAPRIPASVISMRTTAPALSNKNKYPTFLRTDQPVSGFSRAVTALFKELKWEKVVIVYGDDKYGVGGYKEVLQAAFDAGVCVSTAIPVPHVGTEQEYVAKLQDLASHNTTGAVFYGNPTDALMTLQALQKVSGVQNMKWLFGQLELETDYSMYTAAQGAIVVRQSATTINDFKNYYTSLSLTNPSAENPWLRDWYMYKYQCRLDATVNYAPFNTMPTCSNTINRAQDFRQSPYVEQTILAIYTYAEAIKRVCGGLSGVCSPLKNMSPLDFHKNYLSKVDITLPTTFPIPELRGRRLAYDVNGDLLFSGYTFYNYASSGGSYVFQKFASYSYGNLQMTSRPVFTRTGSANLPESSECPTGGCVKCVQPTKGITLTYKPGDYVVMALVNAHASDRQHMTCMEAIPDRLIEAVAVQYSGTRNNVLSSRGLTLGYLVVDICPGLQSARSFLTNLLGGFRLYTDSTGTIISTTNIVAVLDMTRIDTGLGIAGILASVGLPHVRIAPTSMDFLRPSLYPRLVSVVPSQETVQLSVLQMLSGLNWNYVQVVSESHSYYHRAAENFRRQASRMNICVGLWSTFNMDAESIIRRIRSAQSSPVVVLFVSNRNLRRLLEAVRTVNGSQGQITFVSGSEDLGMSDTILAGYEREAQGMITVQLKETGNAQFKTWLSGLSLSQIASDVFLAEWFENKFDCSLMMASRGSYNQVCTSPTNLASTNVYLGYGPYVVQALDSVAAALKQILDTYCTGSSQGSCPQMRNTNILSQRLVDALRNSNSNSFQIVNGEGMSNLVYFNYRNGVFNNVGTFNTANRRISSLSPSAITMATGALASTVSTQCTGRCTACQYGYGFQEFGYVHGDWLIAATFSISHPGPDGQRPYVCGDIRTTNGYQYSAAMMYALNHINSGLGPVKLNNVTLGGLYMDHCNNERRAYGQVADVYSGLFEYNWNDTMVGMEPFRSQKILAWLTDNTASTREAAEILQPVGLSIVSPSATAPSLMDNPTFFRTIQGDNSLALAIAKLCKMLGLNYIQVVHAANSYGREGLTTMTNVARQEGLCVISSYELADSGNVSLAVNTVSGATSRVVVLFMGTTLTRSFLEEASKLGANSRLTIIAPETYGSMVTSLNNRINLRNLISLQLQHPIFQDFLTFLNDVDKNRQNPFYSRYYMMLLQCNLPGYYMYTRDCSGQNLTTASGYVLSNFDLSTINAVYAVAGALHMTLVEFCGNNYTDECMAFMQSDGMYNRFVENLKVVRFTDPSRREFQFLERQGNVKYDVVRFDGTQYEKVGQYGGASLELTNAAQLAAHYSNVQASCSSRCSECIFSGLSFSFTPGDIYLAGVFDVHKQGQGVFDCGIINSVNGFQLLEAFHFALEQVNSKKGRFADILPGVTLGGVGLDACQSRIRGGYLVSNINNGLVSLVRDGKEIRPEDIDVYIGSYSSDSSLYLARILTDLKIPQISYASTSNALDDQITYPYFFRTVPADDKQVLGTLRYLDANNIRYVQLLYTVDAYGEQGKAQFDLLIERYNFSVCVAQRVGFPDSAVVSAESSDDVVTELLQKPVANTVVIFAGTGHIRAFLEAVARNPAAVGTFKFVGPTTWGDKQSVTENIRDVANDAVTFALDFQGGVGNFLSSYLTKRNPSNAGNNPWFEEWFQYTLNCYTSPSNAQLYPRPCAADADLRTRVVEDNTNLHVMNAVYSAAFALDATLKEKCGENYAAVCEAYRISRDRGSQVRDNLDAVSFIDDTNTEFHFVNRTGNKGYKLFKLTTSPIDSDVIYNQDPIGSFSSEGVLTLEMDLVPKYDASCERKGACVECPNVRNRGMRYAVAGDLNGMLTLVGVFDVHNRGNDLYQCGSINMDGMQKFLTFWSFDKLAKQNNIRLLALDTCSSSLRVGQDLYGLLKDGTLCNSDFFDLDRLGMDNIGAVLVTEEDNAVSATRLLEPLRMTQLSTDSVSPLMDSYKYLLRSITPWSGYVRLLLKFLVDNGWTYVNSIYVSSGMGAEQYRVFQEQSQDNKVCLSPGLALPEGADDTDIRVALTQLDDSAGAQVVVLFTPPVLTVRILTLAQELGLAQKFLWIFAWDNSYGSVSFPADMTFEAMALQAVIPDRNEVKNYTKLLRYYLHNDDHNLARIPRVWWEDFYQTVRRCRLDNAEYPLDFSRPCSLNEDFTDSDIQLNKMVHYTFLASAFSIRGLGEFFGQECISGESLQACLDRRDFTRQDVHSSILEMQLNVPADDTTYQFYKPMRYIEASYKIYHVNVRNGVMTRPLYMEYKDRDFTSSSAKYGKNSTCQRPDGCGCATKGSPYAQAQTSQFDPTMPRNYYKYDSTGNQLYEWPVWAIVVGLLTSLGLLVTILIFFYLLIFYPVRGGTSVLGYLTMVGIMGVYAVNFAFFLHASDATCGARRFVMGVVYVIVFAPLLVKAVDNWRFADVEYGNRPYRGLTSSLTLFLIALGIILIQCIIPVEWLILVHPTASKWTNSPVHDYWWCDPPDFYDIGLVCSFIFVMFIVLLTAIFASLAWDSESNNRESRWILVSAIATAGCFLVWMIVTTNAGPIYRDPAVAIANFVNATLLLMLIPIRKLHLLCQAQNDKPMAYEDNQFEPYSYNNQTYDPDGDEYTYPGEKPDEFIAN